MDSLTHDGCTVCGGAEQQLLVLDGVCDACEDIWMECISLLSTRLPPTTPTSVMLSLACTGARYRYHKRKTAAAVETT